LTGKEESRFLRHWRWISAQGKEFRDGQEENRVSVDFIGIVGRLESME